MQTQVVYADTNVVSFVFLFSKQADYNTSVSPKLETPKLMEARAIQRKSQIAAAGGSWLQLAAGGGRRWQLVAGGSWQTRKCSS